MGLQVSRENKYLIGTQNLKELVFLIEFLQLFYKCLDSIRQLCLCTIHIPQIPPKLSRTLTMVVQLKLKKKFCHLPFLAGILTFPFLVGILTFWTLYLDFTSVRSTASDSYEGFVAAAIEPMLQTMTGYQLSILEQECHLFGLSKCQNYNKKLNIAKSSKK